MMFILSFFFSLPKLLMILQRVSRYSLYLLTKVIHDFQIEFDFEQIGLLGSLSNNNGDGIENVTNLHILVGKNNKHLMTGPKGNSEFCFPETLNVPRGEAEGNIEVEGKQNSLFPEGPVIKCFVIPPNSK